MSTQPDSSTTAEQPPELKVGDPAPDFALPDDTGAVRRLSDQRGRYLVLYFYPKDDSPGCTVEACEFRDANDQITDVNAEVWGVSVLDSASKAAFKSKFGLPFVLLADEDHAVAEQYGVWRLRQMAGKEFFGIQRGTFLIDPEGRIAKAWNHVKPEGHAAQVVAAIREHQASAGRAH